MKKKIALVYPGEFYSMKWGRLLTLKPHMVYIHAYLSPYFDVEVIDLENEIGRPEDEASLAEFKKKGLERLLSVHADILAISCWSSLNYLATRYFAAAYKQERPQTLVVVGGYHPTFVPEDFVYENSPFDHVVKGEIGNLFSALGMDAPGLEHTYEIVPDFRAYPYYDGQRTVGVYLGGGCPFNCRYCMEYKKRWSSLSVESAISRIKEACDQIPLKYITIFDACFGLDRQWKRAFLTELATLDLDLYFWFETRVDLVDDQDIQLLSRLKVKMDLGIDSLSPTMLGIMRKSVNPHRYLEDFIRVSKGFSKGNIFHDSFMILDHPGETQETWDEFKDFLYSRIFPELGSGYLKISYQRFSYYPGSYIYNHHREYENRYGFKAHHPQWWKEPFDHYRLSRRTTPSADGKGRAFNVPLQEASVMVKTFNANTREPEMWKRLNSFSM